MKTKLILLCSEQDGSFKTIIPSKSVNNSSRNLTVKLMLFDGDRYPIINTKLYFLGR